MRSSSKGVNMSIEKADPEPNRLPSFEEFRETILQHGADPDFLEQIANLYGNAPRLMRILHNFDPTGVASAVDQIISEKKSEQEQESILHAIYTLAVKVWKIEGTSEPKLSDDKFMFLYLVYVKSETDRFANVETDEIQNELKLPQHKIISIAQYLDKYELIKFDTWVQGIKIAHKGIVRVEADLLGNTKLPTYVSADEIRKIEKRIRLRYDLLHNLYEEAKEDTFKQILHADLAEKSQLEHTSVISQYIPYMTEEGWLRYRTADSVSITEEGIERAAKLLT